MITALPGWRPDHRVSGAPSLLFPPIKRSYNKSTFANTEQTPLLAADRTTTTRMGHILELCGNSEGVGEDRQYHLVS